MLTTWPFSVRSPANPGGQFRAKLKPIAGRGAAFLGWAVSDFVVSRRSASLLLAATLLTIALPVAAQLDTMRRASIVRAGPDNLFPQVARLPIASSVHIFGCTANRSWCDVLSGRTRGWVPVNDLSQSSRLRNAPALTFSVAEYWDTHYRRRAWYANRDNWLGWGTPGWQPPAAR